MYVLHYTDMFRSYTGKDATESFEDVGHSDEARELLKGLLVGTFDGGAVRFLSIFYLMLIERMRVANAG
jgi:cytochrome b involved in lipid metabolism